MKRCTRCLIPDTRPDTAFVDGVCSACLTHDAARSIDWDSRLDDLLALFERTPKNGTGYDCIVASSGGKDSHAQAGTLIELGFRPLLVTATTCMLTQIGRYNIENLKRHAATIEVTPNQEVRRKLNYLGLTMVGDVSWPEHVAIFTTPIRIAVALGIPLVFYGENPQAQYGGPIGADEARQMTRRWVSEFGGFLGLRPSDMVGQAGITREQMAEYQFPTDEELQRVGVKAHFLGQYIGPWDSHRNAEVARRMGMHQVLPFVGNWWPHENLDNAMTGLHDHMMYRKYGLSRACAQLSVDVRDGRIDREHALVELHEREHYFPDRYAGVPMKEVLGRLGITLDELKVIMRRFSAHH